MSVLSLLLAGSSSAALAAAIAFASSTTTATATPTTHTFSSQAIGTAAANRYVLVSVSTTNSGGSPQTLSSLTVAGQTCTQVASSLATSGSRTTRFFITNAPVTSGTTANIVINHSGFDGITIGVWALTNLNSNTATGANTSNGTEPLGAAVSCSAAGVVAAAFHVDTVSAGNVTWTGATEVFDDSYDSGRKSSGASDAFATAQTVTPTASCATGTFATCTLSVVTFR